MNNLLLIDTEQQKLKVLNVGELEIPLVLDDEIEVYIDSEKIYSNKMS
jgi:hypothetical protein